jgi:outer membrane protein assembly factor BamB
LILLLIFVVHMKTAIQVDDENTYALGAGKELQVTTDKPVYRVGEPVRISLANTGSETIGLSGDPPFDIYNEAGDPVCCVHLWITFDINPGEVLNYIWDQTTVWTGDQVPPGTYKVEALSELPVEPSTAFVIEAVSGPITFPVGSYVIPMDEKQPALTATDTTVYGLIWSILDNGADLYRIIEPPDVSLHTVANPGGTIYSGGPILAMPTDGPIITATQADFPTVTIDTLTEEFTSDQVFTIVEPTKILLIYGIFGETDKDLDAMRIPYDLVTTSVVEADPSILHNYNLVVDDCPGWYGDVPAEVADSFEAFVNRGGEIIFTDIALDDLAVTFPGFVSVVDNQDGVWDVKVHNPPKTSPSIALGEFPSQYPSTFPKDIDVYTMTAGRIVDKIATGHEDDVRIWMDDPDYGSVSEYRVLGFYFEYGHGIVEGMAYHPQEQTESITGDPWSFVAGTIFFGNKFVHGVLPPIPPCERAVNVVFEESNLPLYTIGSNPAGDVIGGYEEFASNLIRQGCNVSTINPATTIDAQVLEPVDVLVIVCPQDAYSTSEVNAIANWVKADGGRLLLIGEWNGPGLQSNRIAAKFDFFLEGDMIRDLDEYVGLDTGRPYYDGANLRVHPITSGVSRVEVYKGDGIYRSPIDEIVLISTDLDGTATWYYGEPAPGVPVMSALDGGTAGSGKLVLMTDTNAWDSCHDTDSDGDPNFYDSDNAALALNSIDWLAEGIALGELTEEWNYTLGPIDYFQTFCPSAAIADLGVNNNNGEPDPDLEIVTGSDEWHGSQMWHCLDTTGQNEWILSTGCDESRSSVAIADIDGDKDLEIAGGTTSGWLLQVFDHRGSFIWDYYPGYYAFWKSSPAICELNPSIAGLEVVAATYQDGTVSCFNGVTGTVLWNYTIGAIVESSPACGDVDNDGVSEIVIGAYDGFIYCFDAVTGGLERTYRTGGSVLSSTALANADRDSNLEVFAGSNDGKIYCFDGDATIQWTYQTAGAVLSSPAVGDVTADGRYEVVVGSNDGNIYCLDAGTGTLVWSHKTDGPVISSPALADRGGTGLGIYIASMDGYLYVLDGNGKLFDRFNTQATNGITSSPVVGDTDGDCKIEVIFTDWNAIPDDPTKTNRVWCLEDCGSNVTEYAIEWQMFRHDPCRTGLYPKVTRPPAPHDVAIAGVTTTKNNPVTGETITINVFVQNQGTATETFTVSVDCDGVTIGSTSVTLTSAATTTETFIWDTTGVSAGSYRIEADASIVPGETDIADNTFFVPIQILPALFHDVAVNSVTPSKIFVVAGETISVDVEVENEGDYTETFTVDAYYDGNSIDSLTATLAPGTSKTLTFSWDTTNVPKGVYTLKAAAAAVPNEIETFDNTFTSIVQVTVAVHDIAIVFVLPVETVLIQGLDATIAVEVIIQGDFTETFDLAVYANATMIQTKTINLESKYNMLATFTWDTEAVLSGKYAISAHATPVAGETDIADNTLIDGWVQVIALAGDLNGDCVVNILDIAIVGQAFGSNPGHPRWNPIADLDHNNNVNIIDISIVAKEFGKTC